MTVFHGDLDNTLIYSYKHDIGVEKSCVEHYNGKELSFMTLRSLDMLMQLNKKVIFVPTTTRTEEQYKRICLGGLEPEYALVCNGGVLLKNGIPDKEWYLESLSFADECRAELKQAERLLEIDSHRTMEAKNIESLFLFTKSNEPEKTIDMLINEVNTDKLDIFQNGVKVYALPKLLSKGMAVKRFRKRINEGTVIAAGDSLFDISMLNEADIGLAPEPLTGEAGLRADLIWFSGNELFSEQILDFLLHGLEK